MPRDESDAIDILTDAMRDEEADRLVRVLAAAAFLHWSTMESIARHFDEERQR